LARILIVGCGCRGRELARALVQRGDAVRGTSRDPDRMGEIQAAGAEAVLADPDRIASLFGAFDGVAVVCILLGSAAGPPEAVRALHTTRLEMLLFKLIDTSVRGVVYEAAGSLPAELLEAGAGAVRTACERSRIPYALLDGAAGTAWPAAGISGIDRVLGAASGR
jgi:uncharacterized protein YbjT (DUF2867 family)